MKNSLSSAMLAAALMLGGSSLEAGGGKIPAAAKLPDIRTVVPSHLQIVNPGTGEKRELLRFSNGVANLGDGPWRMRPGFPLGDITQPQLAIQELLDSRDSSGAVVAQKVVSQFQWHVTHNHWHIDSIALFELRHSKGGVASSADIGGLVGSSTRKTTFCLIDWIRYEGNTNNGKKTDRAYFDCAGENQGVSVGWVDQYHHATDGQELELTNAAPGYYYLYSVANPDGMFIEKDPTNNSAWVMFELTRDSEGNAKIFPIVDSHEAEGTGLPLTSTANR